MHAFARATRDDGPVHRIEWPTWIALVGCYGLWGASLWAAGALGWWALAPTALAAAFHSSLMHEALHGHPTRSGLWNEVLVFCGPGVFIPYRRFRDLHLRHHNDARLTDPYDDPESFYTPAPAWAAASAVRRVLLQVNATLLGRMAIGPALGLWGFWRADLVAMLSGDRRTAGAWLRHGAGLVPIIAAVHAAGVPLWAYLAFVAYPAMSVIMIRSFIEHRADSRAAFRTAVVDAHWFWRLLFLNNNFHAVHHERPGLAWYRIPEAWRGAQGPMLGRNGGYYLSGYGAVFRRWAIRPREPVVHPLGRDGPGGGAA